MHPAAPLLFCLAYAGERVRGKSNVKHPDSQQGRSLIGGWTRSADGTSLRLQRHPGLSSPFQALSFFLLSFNPVAFGQLPGSGHGCKLAARGSSGTSEPVMRQKDGLERRSLLAGFAAVTASWHTARNAMAAEKTGFVKVVVNGKEERLPAMVLAPNFADGFKLQIKEISGEIFDQFYLQDMKEQPAYPFKKKDMKRFDESDDGEFYEYPRLVYHIDEGAVAALTNYYKTSIMNSKLDILDICSSWVSHYPKDFKERMSSIVGTGMNPLELQANSQLTSFVARDLNKEPTLPFPDSSFDIVTCVVSVDYLTSPLKIFKEVNRVLKPGGRFIVSQSNRLFQTKAVDVWLGCRDVDDRLRLIGKYFQYAGDFTTPKAFDISAQGKNVRGTKAEDPMYVVEAAKA